MTVQSAAVVTLLIVTSLVQCKDGPRRIGIIGAGVGGASTAHFLRENFGPDVEIVIYEEEENVGGRLKVVNMAEPGEPESLYEIGGTVIHPKNQLMKQLVQVAGLREKPPAKVASDTRFTIYGRPGQDPLFQTYFGNSYLQQLEVIWRYGLRSLMEMNSLVGNLVKNFNRLYSFLDFGHWENTKDLVQAVGPHVNPLIDMSLAKALEAHSIGRTLIEELVTVAVRVNYGQMPQDVHAFVGYIALAGIEGGLWSIEGGNYRLPQSLIKLSLSKLVSGRVESVTRLEDGGQLVVRSAGGKEEVFDILVVAAPQTSDKVPLDLSNVSSTDFPGNYHRTVATLVRCQSLNPTYFQNSPTETNFYVDKSSLINSIAKQQPVTPDQRDLNVYKVFTQSPLAEEVLDTIFLNRSKTVVVDWLAYPHYQAGSTPWPQPFKLSDRVYYSSAVEWAGSAMEMSAIAAKNVANYAFNEWYDVTKFNDTKINDLDKNEL